MTKYELWSIYVEKNPKFEEPEGTVTFTTKGLKQFFDRTFEHGVTEGFRQAGETEDYPQEPPHKYKKYDTGSPSNPFPDLFEQLFGR